MDEYIDAIRPILSRPDAASELASADGVVGGDVITNGIPVEIDVEVA